MRLITHKAQLAVGRRVYYVERGVMTGPFEVVRLTGARTVEHVVLRSQTGVLFEQYVPHTQLGAGGMSDSR